LKVLNELAGFVDGDEEFLELSVLAGPDGVLVVSGVLFSCEGVFVVS
jgi:hypothetical protein